MPVRGRTGRPILAIRNLLRRRVFDPGVVRKVLKVDEGEAGRVIDALKAESYMCNLFDKDAPPDVWQTTPKGSVLAGSHARPQAVPTARRLLNRPPHRGGQEAYCRGATSPLGAPCGPLRKIPRTL